MASEEGAEGLKDSRVELLAEADAIEKEKSIAILKNATDALRELEAVRRVAPDLDVDDHVARFEKVGLVIWELIEANRPSIEDIVHILAVIPPKLFDDVFGVFHAQIDKEVAQAASKAQSDKIKRLLQIAHAAIHSRTDIELDRHRGYLQEVENLRREPPGGSDKS